MKKFFIISSIICGTYVIGFCQEDIQSDVTTPKGSTVIAWVNAEQESAFRESFDNGYALAYPENLMIDTYDQKSSTRRFNCHGYAWHIVESDSGLCDPRWIGYDSINEEDIYMTDGSYIQVATEMYPGKVSWDSSDHTAITTTEQGIYISKWNQYPLFQHPWDNTPYGTSDLKYYVSTNINGSASLLCQGTSRCFHSVTIPNASYNWTVGNGLTKIEYGDSVIVTANNNYSGLTYVEVTITSPLGNNQVDTKTSKKLNFVIGGLPSEPIVNPSGFPPIQMGIYSYQDIVLGNYPGSATWSSSGSVETIWTEGQTGRFYSTSEGNAYFYVTTQNECGSSSLYQGGIEVLDDMMNSVTPDIDMLSFAVIPNPCNTFFDLTLITSDPESISNDYVIEIFDYYSRLVNKIEVGGINNRISVQNLMDGNYLVRVTIDGKFYHQKLIVNKE